MSDIKGCAYCKESPIKLHDSIDELSDGMSVEIVHDYVPIYAEEEKPRPAIIAAAFYDGGYCAGADKNPVGWMAVGGQHFCAECQADIAKLREQRSKKDKAKKATSEE